MPPDVPAPGQYLPLECGLDSVTTSYKYDKSDEIGASLVGL